MQVAIVTDFEYRAQVIEPILLEHGWQLLACIAQASPQEWLLQQRGMDIILVDLNIADAVGLVKTLTVALPQIPIVTLATPQRIIELQDAMLAGAANFVAFPIEPKQLIATIERTYHGIQRPIQTNSAHALAPTITRNGAHSRHLGRVLVVTSLKGGVGRSTIAANMAIGLRQQTGRNIVLVEAQHGLGHLALLFNLYPRHTITNLDGEPNLDLELLQGLLQSHGSGVRLLAAPADPAQLVELSAEVWQQVIRLLKETADYVVVDTAAHADELLSTLLALADDILVITGADIASLRDARLLLQSLRHENQVDGRIHVVLNHAGAQGGVDERIVQDQLGEPVAAALPEDLPLATFAFNRGVPFVLSHPRALLSRRLAALLERLVLDSTGLAMPAARPSLFSFLRFGDK